jgi:hypothetical protein
MSASTLTPDQQAIFDHLMGVAPASTAVAVAEPEPVKRGRGRPKKVIDPNAVVVKRKPGRPPGTKKDAAIALIDEKDRPLSYLLKLKATPIDFNAEGLTQAAVIKIRREASIACLPYCHPKLEAVELSATVKRPIWVLQFRDGSTKEIYGARR